MRPKHGHKLLQRPRQTLLSVRQKAVKHKTVKIKDKTNARNPCQWYRRRRCYSGISSRDSLLKIVHDQSSKKLAAWACRIQSHIVDCASVLQRIFQIEAFICGVQNRRKFRIDQRLEAKKEIANAA